MTWQLQSIRTGMARSGFLQLALAAVAVAGIISRVSAGPITPGNLVVVQIGDGTVFASGTTAPVFLKEFTTAGAPVNTINLPTTTILSNKRMTNSISATSEGFITLSSNGLYLFQIGYDAATGTANINMTTSAATNRVVGRTDMSGIVDTSTALTDASSADNVRSATSDNGTNIWVGGGAGGARYATLGATTSTQLNSTSTNMRVLNVFGGQLYASSGTAAIRGVNTVGSGLPTTGSQTIALLGTGWNTANSPSPYDYVFLASNTLYIADDSTIASGNGGIQRWTLSGGTWSRSYVLKTNLSSGCRGVTLGPPSINPVLYATSGDTNNSLVTVTDVGAASPFTVLATSGSNKAFRGVRYVPGCTAAPSIAGPGQPISASVCLGSPASFSVTASGSSSFTYQWRRATTPLVNGLTGSGSTLSGVNTATLTINNAQTGDAGNDYNCRVTNNCGFTDTNLATLTVTSSCDDGIPCTIDSCSNGVCSNLPSGTCNQLSLNVVGNGNVCAGNTLDVKLDVSGLLQAINGVQALVQYDPALLSLSSVSTGNGAGSPWDIASPIALIDNAGVVTYALALSGPGSSANATVATFHFAVQLPGSNIDPTNVIFRPNQGPLQTKLTVASDNSTILPNKVDSGPITVGPRVTVALHVQGLSHAVTRDVTFVLTDCGNQGSPQTIVKSAAFNASGNGNVVLTGVDPAADYLAVVEGHTLRRRVLLSWSSCFATSSFTGGSELISGDLQTSDIPQDSLVDILDFAILAARFGTVVSDCGVGLPQDCSLGADITGDGLQETADFTAIQINFFKQGDEPNECPAILMDSKGRRDLSNASNPTDGLGGKVARKSISANELPVGLSSTRVDLNGDGVVDANDIRSFAQVRGLPLLPEFEAKLKSKEAAPVEPSR